MNGVLGVRWLIGSDSVHMNAFKKQQDYLLKIANCIVISRRTANAWFGLCLCMVSRIFFNFQWPLFFLLALCSGSEGAIGPKSACEHGWFPVRCVRSNV